MNRGFTLLETLIYLALYALLITGAFSAAYSFSESSARNEMSAFVQEEGTFLVGKINWALTDAVSVQSPASSGTTLQITRADGSSVRVRSRSSAILMQIGTDSEAAISSTNVSVANLAFVHATQPASVSASFTLTATTSDGHPVSADFSTLVYLPE